LTAATDVQLVERALAGDQDACRGLVSRYERSVYNLVARMLRDPARAQDITQDVFIRAFRHLASFDPAHKFSNWILRIARNAAIDAIRRREPEWVPLDQEGEDRASPLDTIPAPRGEDGPWRLEREEAARALEAALARLRPEYREVIVLRYHEDLSYEEITEVTGLPLGTVKSFLHRARAEMAAEMLKGGWKR
jgi:RNA polymerase sigma-70 factor, ECF subfamily